MDSTIFGALIGVGGGAATQLASWGFRRRASRNKHFGPLYLNWASIAHEALVVIRGIAADIAVNTPACGYENAAKAFLALDGANQVHELGTLVRGLELAEFQLSHDRNEPFVEQAMRITGMITTMVTSLQTAPVNVAPAFEVLLDFTLDDIPRRFGTVQG